MKKKKEYYFVTKDEYGNFFEYVYSCAKSAKTKAAWLSALCGVTVTQWVTERDKQQ